MLVAAQQSTIIRFSCPFFSLFCPVLPGTEVFLTKHCPIVFENNKPKNIELGQKVCAPVNRVKILNLVFCVICLIFLNKISLIKL